MQAPKYCLPLGGRDSQDAGGFGGRDELRMRRVETTGMNSRGQYLCFYTGYNI